MVGQALRNKQLDNIYRHTCSRCGGHITNDDAIIPAEMQQEAERIAKGLYDGTITSGTIDPLMTKLVAEHLRKAVIDGFGKDLPKISYGTPDYKMLASLETNVFHFSAAENFQMLKSMSLALVDENGKLREYKDFKKEAANVAGVYLGKHLRTEYDTATGSAQMAGKWVEFEKNKATAPWLRYDTVHDSRVRPEHKKLDGVIKRVTDEFWLLWYPPNGWNCRCDVTQLIHGAETRADQVQLPDDVPDMFKTNMAKEGLVFPAGHPYYIGLPEAFKKKAAALRTAQYSQAYPTTGETTAGGKVSVSSMADPVDLKYNIEKGGLLADAGETVRIRPHVEEQGIKNPELDLYNGTQKGDFKQPVPKSNFKNSYEHQVLAAQKQQAQIPVLVLNEKNYKKLELIRSLNNNEMWKKATGITEVWLLYENRLIKITREEIAMRTYYHKLP